MTILLIRANRNEVDEDALRERGIPSVVDPYLTITPAENPAGVARMREALSAPGQKWLVVTSTNSLPMLAAALNPGELDIIIGHQPDLRFAAIGAQTELQLRERGAGEILRGRDADSSSLAELLSTQEPCPVIIPSSNISMRTLHSELTQRGFSVVEEVVYVTETVAQVPPSCAGVHSGKYAGVLLRSPSAARAFATFNRDSSIPLFCAGRVTAAQVENLGLSPAAVSPDPTPDSIAQTIDEYLKVHS